MTDIDTAAIRAEYAPRGGWYPVIPAVLFHQVLDALDAARADVASVTKGREFVRDELRLAADALDAARLENANHEKLVRDAYSFAERMLPVVEAARALIALKQRYVASADDALLGNDLEMATARIEAAAAAYEAQQGEPPRKTQAEVNAEMDAKYPIAPPEKLRAYVGGEQLKVTWPEKVVQPSSPVEGRTAEGREDVGEQSAAGDLFIGGEAFQRTVREMSNVEHTAGDQRGCDHKCLDMFGKCIHCAWMNSFAIVAERDATIARLRAALQEAADALDKALGAVPYFSFPEVQAVRDKARAAAKEGE